MAKPGATASRHLLTKEARSLANKVKGMAPSAPKGMSVAGEVAAASLGLDVISAIADTVQDIRGNRSPNPMPISSAPAETPEDRLKKAKNITVEFRRIDPVESVNLAGMFLSGPPPAGASISPAMSEGLNGPSLKGLVQDQMQIQRDLDNYGNVASALGKKQLEQDALAGDHKARQTVRNINRS